MMAVLPQWSTHWAAGHPSAVKAQFESTDDVGGWTWTVFLQLSLSQSLYVSLTVCRNQLLTVDNEPAKHALSLLSTRKHH